MEEPPPTDALAAIHSLFKYQKCNSVIDEESGNALEYRNLIHTPEKHLWTRAISNDLGMFAQGVGTSMKKGTNTIRLIPREKVPKGQQVTYPRLVASLRPHKK